MGRVERNFFDAIADIPVLEISEEMTELAALLFERLGIP